jgi:hypothetical protein
VTDDGFFNLNLMGILWKRKTLGKLLLRGTFSGLEIMESGSDFPLILTTRKSPYCSFLEIRGMTGRQIKIK